MIKIEAKKNSCILIEFLNFGKNNQKSKTNGKRKMSINLFVNFLGNL